MRGGAWTAEGARTEEGMGKVRRGGGGGRGGGGDEEGAEEGGAEAEAEVGTGKVRGTKQQRRTSPPPGHQPPLLLPRRVPLVPPSG